MHKNDAHPECFSVMTATLTLSLPAWRAIAAGLLHTPRPDVPAAVVALRVGG